MTINQMRIKISWDEGSTFERECDLRDAFCQWDDEYYTALNELKRIGRYWIGGGAQPLGLLIAIGGK